MDREDMVKSVSRALDIITLVSLKKGGMAAVSISGPTIRMTDERLKLLQVRMIHIGKQISTRPGFG